MPSPDPGPDDDVPRRLAGVEPPSPHAQAPRDDLAVEPSRPSWWPAVPPPPPPGSGGTSLGPYVAWLDTVLAATSARVDENRRELDRLHSQWVHVLPNLARLHSEEVASIAEKLARARERIAAEIALHHLLVIERVQ